MTQAVLHIVEPTLESGAGHCHSFVSAFCGAGEGSGCSMTLYAGRSARLPGLEKKGVRVVPHFGRRLRRPQAFMLFRKLLREPGRIFIPTATRFDLALLSLAAAGRIPPGKACLYFHWFRPDERKRRYLAGMAKEQPDVALLGPTESVVKIFRECGYARAEIAPYPITPFDRDTFPAEAAFRHLLYAGAARADKGFPDVVGLIAWMAARGETVPVSLQASPDHYDRYEPRVRAEIDRLGKIGYPYLQVRRETLDEEAYSEQFRGAICLQPYSPGDFVDRLSGVTLDALSRGCPIVTLGGTWMARVVDRFEAGKTVETAAPEALFAAAGEILRDYGRYSRNAARAGVALQEELSAKRLFDIVTA